MWAKLIFVIIVLISVFISSRIQSGTCPHIETVNNFTASQYVGKWFEIEKFPFIWETGQKCITAEYSLNSDGTVKVLNTGIFKFIDYPVSVEGLATADPTNPSKLSVSFSRFGKGPYWVIDTDYTTYSLVYSCKNIPYISYRIENSWILSRTTTLTEKTIKYLKQLLTSAKIGTNHFVKTDQTNCLHK